MGFLDIVANVLFDDSDMTSKLAKNQAGIDRQREEWRRQRQQTLLEMHSLNLGISLMVQTLRTVVRATGQTLTPMQNASLSMIQSTSSLIIATATAMAAGSLGLLAGAALALAAFAVGFQLVQTAKVFADMEKVKADFAASDARLANLARTIARTTGRSF